MKNKSAIKFRELLYNWSQSEYIGTIFYQLFTLKTDNELQEELEYLYTLYKGTDNYFKSESIDCWFTIWHKSIRQCDYFSDCFKVNSVNLVTDDERKEFRFLANECRKEGFSKTEGKKDNELFNETYNRYLDLFELVRRERKEERKEDSINGKLDSILWNLIQLDSECKLEKIFIETFKIM